MSEHARNPNAAETRPRCGSCVHYYRDGPTAGHCRLMPPTPFHLPAANKLGQVSMTLQSTWPPTAPDRWCGAHPDFMRWFSAHREDARQIADLEQRPQEGQA